MAMYIDAEPNMHARWHVGEPVTNVRLWQAQPITILADGDELEYVRTHISGIRMSDAKAVSWYGEDASFIARAIWNREHNTIRRHT